jgi:hypothetical protein
VARNGGERKEGLPANRNRHPGGGRDPVYGEISDLRIWTPAFAGVTEKDR